MKKNPKVSIIIPIYNVSSYIKKCALSVINQSYSNIEVVFVNDKSPDDSIEQLNDLMRAYPDMQQNVIIISHEENKGLAEARNTGVLAATGDYIMHLDSDDYLEPNAVEKCVSIINAEEADAVIFGMRHIFNKFSIIEHIKIPQDKTQYINQLIRRQTIVCMCGGLYKSDLYTDNHILAIPGLNMGEDYSTKPRLLYYAKRIVALDEPLYCYNHTNENSYTNRFSDKIINNVTQAISVLSEFFMKQSDYKLYEDSLDYASLSSKVLLLKSWALSDSDKNYFKKIRLLYQEISIRIIPNIIDRFILYLCKYGFARTTRVFVRVAFVIKRHIKRIKEI